MDAVKDVSPLLLLGNTKPYSDGAISEARLLSLICLFINLFPMGDDITTLAYVVSKPYRGTYGGVHTLTKFNSSCICCKQTQSLAFPTLLSSLVSVRGWLVGHEKIFGGAAKYLLCCVQFKIRLDYHRKSNESISCWCEHKHIDNMRKLKEFVKREMLVFFSYVSANHYCIIIIDKIRSKRMLWIRYDART